MRVTQEQVVSHRVRVNGLDTRRAFDESGVRAAAHAGLQDSMPRAAILSLHARLEGVAPDVLDDPLLEQVWGPRFSAFVVAAGDRAPFTLGRMPRRGPGRERAIRTAESLTTFLDGRTMSYADAGEQMGVGSNSLRYGTTTGTIVIRWEGSGRPTVTSVDPPDVDEEDARLELARRFLHVFGPATVDDFAHWAGVRPTEARTTFDALSAEVVTATTPIGEAVLLAADTVSFTEPPQSIGGVRLIPSGDALYLLWGAQRHLFVDDEVRRDELWTSRVWPGALLVDGRIVGTWSRRGSTVDVDPWRALTKAEAADLDDAIAGLPVP